MPKILESILSCDIEAEKIALLFKEREYRYKEVDYAIQHYAFYLTTKGVKKGDKVVLHLSNTPEFIFIYFAVVYLGAVVVPINTLSAEKEIEHYLSDSDASFYITSTEFFDALNLTLEFFNQAGGQTIILSQEEKDLIDSLPCIDVEPGFDVSVPCTFIYTSGTTGKPKAAMLSLHNFRSNVKQLKQTVVLQKDDRWISCLPMFHVYGFTVSTLLPLTAKNSIVIVEQFAPKQVLELIQKYHITIFSGVPMMYIMLANLIKEPFHHEMRLGWVGGDSMEQEMYHLCSQKLNIDLCEGYGLSEASPVCTINVIAEKAHPHHRAKCQSYHKLGSIGPVVEGVEAKIVDDQGCEVGLHCPGELIIRGENVMQGYYKQPEESAKTIQNGWLFTGDIATKDEDGYFYIVDRKKDMIVIGGLNVYSKQVELSILEYPAVKECAVVGIKDKKRGEMVKAFLVLHDSIEFDELELRHFLQERLSGYKIPKYFEVLEALPKNILGKVLKKSLRS